MEQDPVSIKCHKSFHLEPEAVVPERRIWLCPRCSGETELTPDQESVALAQLKQRMDEKISK